MDDIKVYLQRYFNDILRESLHYKSVYQVIIRRGIIKVKAIDLWYSFDDSLSKILQDDEIYVKSLERELIKLFKSQNITIDKIYTKINIMDITFYTILYNNDTIYLDLYLYAEIASYLDIINLELFCFAFGEEVISNNKFWYHLMTVRYPDFIVKGNYNWVVLYKYLIEFIDQRINPLDVITEIINFALIGYSDEMSYQHIKYNIYVYNYVLNNSMVKMMNPVKFVHKLMNLLSLETIKIVLKDQHISKEYIYIIEKAFHTGDIELFKFLLDKYHTENDHYYKLRLSDLRYNNISSIKSDLIRDYLNKNKK